ncbi:MULTISPECIES: O-antigen ligase family protein [unclassified Pseudoalteromonas]|uniref:O-antigen ligase family protein n=1 Tax=unclassified Pseudoalteromonas TaxID=194690 RepID=UPI0005AB403F|nr:MULTISPECIES: O-antigen ligase family protein [unclassified Pseudoalteromonas]
MNYSIFQFTFLLLGCSLAIDTLTGFFVSGLGLDLKLSAMFKFGLLILLIFALACYSRKNIIILFSLMLTLLIGPLFNLINTYDVMGFLFDFSYVIKILTPLMIFLFCIEVIKRWPDNAYRYGLKVFYFSFCVLLFNIIAGILGFGFSSYGSKDGEVSIGIKGFFYAGNEVSGLFVLLFSFILSAAWNSPRKIYFLIMAPIAVISGVLIATKAAMIAGLLLVVLIPLVNERYKMFNLTWLKISIFTPALVGLIAIVYFAVPILQATGLWDRLVWFYEKKGVFGIIFSGRNEFAVATLESFYEHAGIIESLFGIGLSGLAVIERLTVEIEPIDMYFWFGIPGLLYLVGLFCSFIYISYRAALKKISFWAPFALIANILLFGLSFIAGHTLTSGMLAPLWGLLNGMVYLEYSRYMAKNKMVKTHV